MTTTTESKKALSHLLCQASKRASVEVLKQELERNHDSLLKGVLAYQKPTSASQQTFSKKGNMASKLSLFIVELSKFLQVEEETSRKLLQTYLSGKVQQPFGTFLTFWRDRNVTIFRWISWDQGIVEKVGQRRAVPKATALWYLAVLPGRTTVHSANPQGDSHPAQLKNGLEAFANLEGGLQEARREEPVEGQSHRSAQVCDRGRAAKQCQKWQTFLKGSHERLAPF